MNLALLSVILGLASSVVLAAPYVIQNPSTKKTQNVEIYQPKKEESKKEAASDRDTFLSIPDITTRPSSHIGVSSSYSLDRLEGMEWEDSASGVLTDSEGTVRNNTHSLTFGIEYHRRVHPGVGVGLLMERYQPKHIDLTTLSSSSSTSSVVGRSFSATYLLTGALIRNYDFLALGRVYLSPSWRSDPFVQLGVGLAHGRNSFIHPDHQRTVYVSDILGIWQIGAGISYEAGHNYGLEVVGGFRNQHEAKFQEILTNYTLKQTYTLSGSISTLFAFDLKLTLKKYW